MEGTFGSIEKRIIGNGSCLAYKTYSKSHGKLVQQHYQRELWALKQLNICSKESSVENHVNELMGEKSKRLILLRLFILWITKRQVPVII
jgi:hypothetical protein